MVDNKKFSYSVSDFCEQRLPEENAQLAGYAALINAYNLHTPLPDHLFAISTKHKKYEKNRWKMLTPRYTPEHSLYGHLTFALKYEGVDLAVLKALYNAIEPQDIVNIVRQEPTGRYSRRIWFLYEWLKSTRLNLPDARQGNFVDALDSKLQYTGRSTPSERHRVRNNFPGTQEFCPLIRKTDKLEQFISMNLGAQVEKKMRVIHPDILLRAAAFLLLKDSKASYAIEGETPPQDRAQKWGKAIGQAGQRSLSKDELLRLQKIVISDTRFTPLGYRYEGGFIGIHDRLTHLPIPDHISARCQDLDVLMDGLIKTNEILKNSAFDPVLATAIIAFGFVFIHPFVDGNGRIHRYLLHHVLAEKQFAPKGIIFPVSAVILEHIDQYRKILESYSSPRLELIEWSSTATGNVEVINETMDLYRYFDATQQAEFLYECVKETVEKTLPEEVAYLQKYDEMKTFIDNYIDMPNQLTDLLIRFLSQNDGKFSKRARQHEFKALTEKEVEAIEAKFSEVFL